VEPAHGSLSDEHESLIQFLYLTPVGLVQCSGDGLVSMMNPKAAQILMPLSAVPSLDNLFDVLDGFAPQLRAQVLAFDKPSGVLCEAQRFAVGSNPSAHMPPMVLAISIVKFDDRRFMVSLSDATFDERRERLALESRLRDASRIDTLTQIPNRAALNDFLQARLGAKDSGQECNFAVMFINCDRFRLINDALGHATGDAVLRMMAGRLRATLRPYDSVARNVSDDQIAARVGRDEFAVVVANLSEADDAHAVAQRLIAMLANPYGVGAQQLHCPVSMGLVLGPQTSDDSNAVLQDASIAMVRAKRSGGGRYVVFEPPMREEAELRGQLESELRTALSERQLWLAYQPVVGLKGTQGAPDVIDRYAGVEVLVRWRHPTRGQVPPVQFIGVAEDSGLIVPLGAFVLTEAVRQFGVWQRTLGARAPRLLAVNLSRAELREPDFVARVQSLLLQHRVEPQSLQLEVTESLAAQDGDIQARLHELRALGVSLALDDFGTGYSSLASLHLLPVDTVKIDRAFTSQADTSHTHQVLIDATVRVARSLNMRTVCEGVETVAQHALMRELGCDKGQGYLYSKPLAADALVAWLMANGSAAGSSR